MTSEKHIAIPTDKQIEKLVSDKLAQKVSKVEKVATHDSTTFRVKTEEGTYYVRTGGKKSSYDLEHHVIKLLRERGVKTPIPIADNVNLEQYPFTFSILKEVPGINLWNVPTNQWPLILDEVGKQLAILYSIPITGYGTLSTKAFREEGKLMGKKESWYDFLKSSIDKKLAKLNTINEESKGFKNSPLPNKQRDKLLDILNRSEELYSRLERIKSKLELPGVLFHRDLHADHIIIKGYKLEGILDFNNVSSGDPLRDMATFSTHHPGDYHRYLLEGSEVVFNKDKFHLYRLIVSFGKIHYRYNHDYLHTNPDVLDFTLEEMDR